MDYKKIYDIFIASRSISQMDLVMYEVHHILPRSLGGSDCPSNLIRLSYRDHFFAHKLLAKFAGYKMKLALTWFVNGSNANRYHRLPSSRLISKIREDANKVRKNMLTGRSFTDEHKANLSASKKGKPTWNKGLTKDDPRVLRNVENSKKSKNQSPPTAWNKGLKGEEYKLHYNKGLSPPSMTGRIWINNGMEQRKIMKDDIIPEGWTRGRCDIKGDNNPTRKRHED